MEVGANLIGVAKINTKGFCKEKIEKIKKDCPGGSYLVLMINPMESRGRPLIVIG